MEKQVYHEGMSRAWILAGGAVSKGSIGSSEVDNTSDINYIEALTLPPNTP